jgi:hypothetical protein
MITQCFYGLLFTQEEDGNETNVVETLTQKMQIEMNDANFSFNELYLQQGEGVFLE